MKFKRSAVFALLLTAGVAACDDDDLTGLVIGDLNGTWDASTLTFSPTESSSTSNPVPFISLGGDLVVAIGTNGAFSGTLTVPGAMTGGDPADVPVAGTMTLTEDASGNDVVDVNFDAETEATFAQFGLPFEDFDGPISVTSTRITITNETTFDFDFDPETAEEPAALLLVLDKTG